MRANVLGCELDDLDADGTLHVDSGGESDLSADDFVWMHGQKVPDSDLESDSNRPQRHSAGPAGPSARKNVNWGNVRTTNAFLSACLDQGTRLFRNGTKGDSIVKVCGKLQRTLHCSFSETEAPKKLRGLMTKVGCPSPPLHPIPFSLFCLFFSCL